MKNLSFILSALLISLALNYSTTASAQVGGACQVTCPNHAVTRRLLVPAIKAAVLARVNTTRYTNVNIRVQTRLFRRVSGGGSVPLAGLLSGINIEESFHPEGLGIGVSGESAISLQGECVYDYIVRITTSAIDTETNSRVRPATESMIRIVTPLSGRMVCQ